VLCTPNTCSPIMKRHVYVKQCQMSSAKSTFECFVSYILFSQGVLILLKLFGQTPTITTQIASFRKGSLFLTFVHGFSTEITLNCRCSHVADIFLHLRWPSHPHLNFSRWEECIPSASGRYRNADCQTFRHSTGTLSV
jgi:hypothetical protein